MATNIGAGRAAGAVRRQKKRERLGPREVRRLFQLGACLCIFLLLFLGNQVFPQRLTALRETLQETLHQDTEFQAAFFRLGEAFSEKTPAGDLIGNLWVAVFGGGKPAQAAGVPNGAPSELTATKTAFNGYVPTVTAGTASAEALLKSLAEKPVPPPAKLPAVTPPVSADEPVAPPPQPTSHPYSGPKLPNKVSMEYMDLGLAQTVTPVMGGLTSDFGYREHPKTGKEQFHYGTDIGAEVGSPIGAFADGTVDYIGQSPAYGMYIQLRHDGGVTSFYAHCSKLCARKGDRVSMGDKIAEVGATGDATGPHLHLEVRRDGIFYDPIYYVEVQ